MLGFALFYNNLLSGDFDRSCFYRRCTGKLMILEMWDDEKIWGKGRTTKDEDRAGLLPPSEMGEDWHQRCNGNIYLKMELQAVKGAGGSTVFETKWILAIQF